MFLEYFGPDVHHCLLLRSARRRTSKLAFSLSSTTDFLASCFARPVHRLTVSWLARTPPRGPDVWLPRSAGSRGQAERLQTDGQTTRPALAALSSGLDGWMDFQTCCCFAWVARAARPGGSGDGRTERRTTEPAAAVIGRPRRPGQHYTGQKGLVTIVGHRLISNHDRQRRGKKARNVRWGKVGIEPKTFRVPSPARCQLR